MKLWHLDSGLENMNKKVVRSIKRSLRQAIRHERKSRLELENSRIRDKLRLRIEKRQNTQQNTAETPNSIEFKNGSVIKIINTSSSVRSKVKVNKTMIL